MNEKMQIINPKNREEWLSLRTQDITSTEISALFGISPYTTEFELWFQKKEGKVVSIEENERMKWGTRLQDAIASGIAEENGWNIRRMDEYIRDTELRMGSSFDFSIEEGMLQTGENEVNGEKYPVNRIIYLGILEIKNVDSLIFKQKWQDEDKNIEPPLHIQIQVQHQLAVSGRSYAYIGCLVGGNDLHLIKVDRNEKVIEGIKRKVAEFWKSIEENNPPEPDFQRDSEFIASIYGYADPGKFKNVTGNKEIEEMVIEYKEAGKVESEAVKKKKEIKAKLLMLIDDAETVIGDGFKISAGMIGPTRVEAYDKKGYRNFRVTVK